MTQPKFRTIGHSDIEDISSEMESSEQQNNSLSMSTTLDPIILSGKGLTIEQVIMIVRQNYPVEITNDISVHKKMADSCEYIRKTVDESQPLYGVTTLFGGMAHRQISASQASELQNNLVYFHKTGAGAYVPLEDARAAMLLRANSHLIGVSGIRMEITDRLIKFIKEHITPLIPEFGSVGASGDLVPLTYVVGSICGTDKSFKVNFRGEKMNAIDALEQVDLKRMSLQPKEGLAMINGTSMMTASATIAVYDLYILFAATLHAHALAIQALYGNNQPFHPFLHEMKPHHGQKLIASTILDLLSNSKMINDHLDGTHNMRQNVLIQDRYSIRAMPQYLGPFIEMLHQIARTVEVEINSANDNPLIDVENQKAYDVQIAQIVASEFSNGLPDCLISNPQREVNMGVKGLQLCANSIMPYLLFFGNSIADRYSTHAEQYNQNINSMGHVSANLARH
ncbi:unnamed protein product [Didymodactylos carnosus]|nr:unnamed protein product [Didymodactylos carnosus]CAF4019143.1 unnamed protein product [Didymodactylos carnosus]